MDNKERTEYKREYNKEKYKIVKVYIREEEYPAVIDHMKQQGYKKVSGYIKNLIMNDIQGASKNVNTTINVIQENKDGDNNSVINL